MIHSIQMNTHHPERHTTSSSSSSQWIEKNILQLKIQFNQSTHLNQWIQNSKSTIQNPNSSINPFNQSIQSNGSIQSIESIESIESIKTLETPKTPKSPKNTEFPIPPENPQNRGSPGDPQIWRDGTPYLHRTGPPTPDLHPNSDTPNGTPEFNEFKDFIQTLQFNRFLPIHRIQWNP